MKKKILLKILLVFLMGFSLFLNQMDILASEEEVWKREDAVTHQLVEYLKELIANNNWNEIEQYVISRRLTWEEAAEMADKSPAFKNFAEYEELFFNSKEAVIMEADVNGDGILDIIEYLPDVGQLPNGSGMSYPDAQYTLTIFDGGSHFNVMYYQPWFDTLMYSGDEILVIEYEKNIFLLFGRGCKEVTITGYRMKDGEFADRFLLDTEYVEIKPEIMQCKDGFQKKAEILCNRATEYFGADTTSGLFHGSAETLLDEDSDDYMQLKEISQEEKLEYAIRFQELAGGNGMYFSPAIGSSASIMCRCDIDNDGEDEMYVKVRGELNMTSWVGYNWHAIMTNELYGNGKHEGKYGLKYTMVKKGERIDFEKICGLDIWNSENTPQMFWVDKSGNENITYLQYEDIRYGGGGKIEAYDIKSEGYEKVMEVCYAPVCSFQEKYERNKYRASQLSYTVRMSAKLGTAEIFGMENQQLQTRINDGIKVLLWEKLLERLNRNDSPIFSGKVDINVFSATDEKVVIYFLIEYDYIGIDRGYGEKVVMEINLKDGTIRLLNLEREYEQETGW